jgi:ABC-2 type transport system permease protein
MNAAQLWAMLWLRWRLTFNQWRRGGQINAVLTLLAVSVGVGLGVVGGVVGLVAGALGLEEASPRTILQYWDVLVLLFLGCWTLGTIIELQGATLVDLSRLLHLPVSLRDVFLLNYAASHLSFSLAATAPAMLGLTVGLVLGRGAAMVLLLPAVLGFFFMVTAWTYCLRNWLAGLMVNKRRRRAIVAGITLGLVLLSQLPNLLTNVWAGGRRSPPSPDASPEQRAQWIKARVEATAQRDAVMATALNAAHRYVPLLWLPQGAKSLAEGNPWPAICGGLAMTAIGALGLGQAYRGTVRLYRGGAGSKQVAAPAAKPSRAATGRLLVEWTLPGAAEETAAVALATVRSMARAPEVKMAMATNVMIFIIMGASILMHKTSEWPASARPFVAAGAVAITFFGLMQLLFNHFGFDRAGFRAIVLAPSPRRHVLAGKNLAMLPLAAGVFGVYLALAAAVAGLGALEVLEAVLEFGGAYWGLCAIGNLASIIAPYRVAAGSLKPTKTKGLATLLIIAAQMLFPLVVAPVFVPAALAMAVDGTGGPKAAAVALVAAIVLAALSGVVYWQTLEPLGRLLQRREKRVLEVVTQEVE